MDHNLKINTLRELWQQSNERHWLQVHGISMLPLLHEGDNILVSHDLTSLRRGDILVFQKADGLVAHRVIRIKKETDHSNIYLTKGDNCTYFDSPTFRTRCAWKSKLLSYEWQIARPYHSRMAISEQLFGSLPPSTWHLVSRSSSIQTIIAEKVKLKPEDRLLLICLRQDFTAEHSQAVCTLASSQTLDWERIAQTAEQHGISSLIFRNLSLCQADGLEIPAEAFQKLKLSQYKNAVVKERQTERLIRALSFFHERNLEVMLIKGAALDCCVYKNADSVLSDDIDIIIHARREELDHGKNK